MIIGFSISRNMLAKLRHFIQSNALSSFFLALSDYHIIYISISNQQEYSKADVVSIHVYLFRISVNPMLTL